MEKGLSEFAKQLSDLEIKFEGAQLLAKEDAADSAGQEQQDKAWEEILPDLEEACQACDSHMEAFQKLLGRAPQ